MTPPQGLRLRLRAKRAADNFQTFDGIPGLFLRLDRLHELGASPHFLQNWRNGRNLGAAPAAPRHFKNHGSLDQHADWSETEWSRLEKLGKVEFFPGGIRPPRLNVNPCALLLKLRPGVSDEVTESEKYKARLIVDLTRGLVNPRMPCVAVAYGTVDKAVATLTKGCYMFVIDLTDAFFNWLVAEDSS